MRTLAIMALTPLHRPGVPGRTTDPLSVIALLRRSARPMTRGRTIGGIAARRFADLFEFEPARPHQLNGRPVAVAAAGEATPGPASRSCQPASLGESDRTCSMNSS